MSEERVVALAMALKVVLKTACDQGLVLDELTDASVQRLLQHRSYDASRVDMAVHEIEIAADALVQ